MAVPQNYTALAAIWPVLSGTDIASKLAALNITVSSTNPDGSTVLWPYANGWQSLISENDLVPAGIITDDQRRTYEASL